ncbi:hypothetical protein [Clostridium uliginosum]|uniref:Uncharacterized protein n=1 Tax=Clostridium uliginosum TaxID=119641 RepID=A0A1I1I7A8_9CLOT|nr:hypothetical protein [Clostridium uliginosum]SFC31905.1 hypothetical protein SAMN05421842_102149 [Clostridium uliginosum]
MKFKILEPIIYLKNVYKQYISEREDSEKILGILKGINSFIYQEYINS